MFAIKVRHENKFCIIYNTSMYLNTSGRERAAIGADMVEFNRSSSTTNMWCSSLALVNDKLLFKVRKKFKVLLLLKNKTKKVERKQMLKTSNILTVIYILPYFRHASKVLSEILLKMWLKI